MATFKDLSNPFFKVFQNTVGKLLPNKAHSVLTYPSGFRTPSDIDYIRIARVREFWKMYIGEDYLKHFIVKDKDKKKLYNTNYGKSLINKSIMFTIGVPFSFCATENNEAISHICDMVWEANDKALISFQLFQSGSVAGDVFVKVAWDENTKSKDEIERIRLVVLPANYVVPEWDILNPNKMIRCEIHTFLPRDKTKYPFSNQSQGYMDENFMRHTEVITEKEIVEYIDFVEIEGSKRKNILDEVAVIHIPNLLVNKRYWGVSDYVDFVDSQDLLNEIDTNIRNIIAYHEQPTTLIFGAKASKLEKSFNKIWGGFPKDARVENLILGSDLPTTTNFKNSLRDNMYDMSDTPEAMRGKTFPISNTSAAALEMMYFPAILRSKQKKIFYEPGIKKINYFILKTLEAKKKNFNVSNYAKKIFEEVSKSLPKDNTVSSEELVRRDFKVNPYSTSVIWKSVLPKDKQRQLEAIDIKLRNKIIDRRTAMKELGEKNIDQMLQRINEDIKVIGDKTEEKIKKDLEDKKRLLKEEK